MIRDRNDLLSKLRLGIINRREFLAGAAALGLSGAEMSSALAQTPKRGGHLVMGLSQSGTTDNLDPATWVGIFPETFGLEFHDTLTVNDEHGRVQPSLAESWEFKPGAAVWMFKIRKGVTFHNGKTLTPADVVYSLNHHRGPNSKSSAKSLVATFADVAATAPNEVTITLSGGNVDLPYLLTDWHLPIVPDGSTFNGIGTGAFVLESFEPGVRGRGKRNANDWRQDRGYVDTIETLAINDPTARISALLSGAVHIIDTIPTQSVGMLDNNPKVQLAQATGGQHSTLAMACDSAPFNNADLRLAFKYAIDRDAIVKTVLRGYAKAGNDQPVAPGDPMFAPDIPQHTYDPDKAKFYLKKSGFSGPVALTISDSTFTSAIDVVQVFQASAKKAGIEINIDRVPNDGYWENVWRKRPFCGGVWAGRPTADIILTSGYSSGSSLNESHWKSEKFDQLLVVARAEADTAKRKQMYHDLQLMVHDDFGAIVVAFNNYIDCHAKNVGGFVPSVAQRMSGLRGAEKVWFNS